MSGPQSKSPAGWAWHAKKLGLDPENMSTEDMQRAESARRAYLVAMSIKAGKARQRNRAKVLRAKADELERLAADDGDPAR